MTEMEARSVFGLSGLDPLNISGIDYLIRTTQWYLSTWSISLADKFKAERELEALYVLRQIAEQKGETK